MSDVCTYEPDVIRAAAENRWTDALRAHVAGCFECEGAAAVAPWMTSFARISDREHILPDPSVVWLKAKLMQGTVDAGRAARPLDVAQLLAYVVVAGGWAGLVTWRWNDIRAWLTGMTPSGIMETATRVEALSLSFFALVFVLGSMTVMLAMHTILAEE
jgi:hypothetical protein